MEKITLNPETETLAKIGKGTKRKKRDINELEVAEKIASLYKLYHSLNEVAKQVKLSPEMVRQIKSLVTLEEEVKKLYLDGLLKGYDIGYRISKLQGKDQIVLAKYVVDENLSSEDVRAIVRYKIDNPQMPTEGVINKVVQSKDRKIYVAYLGIEEKTFEELQDKAKTKDTTRIIRSIFNGVIPHEFIASFELNGRVVILKVLRGGLQKMRGESKTLKVPLRKLADTLIKKHLKKDK